MHLKNFTERRKINKVDSWFFYRMPLVQYYDLPVHFAFCVKFIHRRAVLVQYDSSYRNRFDKLPVDETSYKLFELLSSVNMAPIGGDGST